MTIVSATTATERLRLYRTHHRIEIDRSDTWDRCDVCSVRVYQVLTRKWQHDPTQVRQLEQDAAREALDRALPDRIAQIAAEGEAIFRDLERENAYYRAHENDRASDFCTQDGHAPGCPCEAGGEAVAALA